MRNVNAACASADAAGVAFWPESGSRGASEGEIFVGENGAAEHAVFLFDIAA